MPTGFVNIVIESALRFGGFRKHDDISIERVLAKYNRKREGQFPATPTYMAAHEMGHVVVAVKKKMRIKYATIHHHQDRIVTPHVSLEKINTTHAHLLYAAGVAGVISAINMDNSENIDHVIQSLYETAQWASENDYEKYLAAKKLGPGPTAESHFAKSVLEALEIIKELNEFFHKGRQALVLNSFHCGYNLMRIKNGEPLNSQFDVESFREARYSSRFKYVWTSINRKNLEWIS